MNEMLMESEWASYTRERTFEPDYMDRTSWVEVTTSGDSYRHYVEGLTDYPTYRLYRLV